MFHRIIDHSHFYNTYNRNYYLMRMHLIGDPSAPSNLRGKQRTEYIPGWMSSSFRPSTSMISCIFKLCQYQVSILLFIYESKNHKTQLSYQQKYTFTLQLINILHSTPKPSHQTLKLPLSNQRCFFAKWDTIIVIVTEDYMCRNKGIQLEVIRTSCSKPEHRPSARCLLANPNKQEEGIDQEHG